jgi:acyl-CoA synthetase (AMP-forming)/AMP-acid ligase II
MTLARSALAPETVPRTRNLVSSLATVVRARAVSPALMYGDEVWSYERLWQAALGVAAHLMSQAPAGQKRVGLLGPNHPEYVAAYFGILQAGGIAIPLNNLLQVHELAVQIRFADLDCCLTERISSDQHQAVAELCDVIDLSDLAPRSRVRLPKLQPDDDATILLTSGSTGTPKGVVHSHRTLNWAVSEMRAALPFSATDVTLAFLPFFASIPEQVLPEIFSGGAIDILPRFDAQDVSRACLRCTSFDAVPTIASRLLDHGAFEALNHLSWVSFASEVMPRSTLEWWWAEVPNARAHQFYGMTELLTLTHANDRLLRQEPTTVGEPFGETSLRIIDDQGVAVGAGIDGEIVSSSPARMTGYFRDPEATGRALTADGAIKTGDVGHLDSKGRLFLTGRLKDIIISGGLNVSPAEIEAVAITYPGVATAAVVGVPDERWGETPVVIVVPKRGVSISPSAILGHCRSHLSGYKRPSGAAVVDALPTTGIGKAAKRDLRNAIVNGHLRIERIP